MSLGSVSLSCLGMGISWSYKQASRGLEGYNPCYSRMRSHNLYVSQTLDTPAVLLLVSFELVYLNTRMTGDTIDYV